MLKILVRTCLQERSINLITRALTTDTVTKKEKWDLLTSVCLERRPVLTPTLNKLKLDFQAYLSQVEYERSLKSDHEIRHENDIKKAELLKKGGTADLEIDGAQLQTAQDFKDLCTEELSKFQFGSRTTEADKTNDLKSLERKLDRYLVLVTENKVGKKSFFLPPQGARMDGESLEQTAERILKENCGDDVKTKIYGNAPVGFYKYKYPKDVQTTNGAVGAKVFIYFARYLNGKMSEKSKFKWLDRQELAKEIPKDFHSSLAKILIDDFPMQQKETRQESVKLKTKTKDEDTKLDNKQKLDNKKSKVEQSTKQNIKTDEKLTKNKSKQEKVTNKKEVKQNTINLKISDIFGAKKKPANQIKDQKILKSDVKSTEEVKPIEKVKKSKVKESDSTPKPIKIEDTAKQDTNQAMTQNTSVKKKKNSKKTK